MAYATVANANALYGADAIAVCCDRDPEDGSLDTTSFEVHLDNATDMMDGYLLGRYPLPLETPPAIFKRICVDIARYTASSPAVMTTQIEELYKAAMLYMRDVAQNRIKLKIAPDTTTGNASMASEAVTKSSIAVIAGDERQMTRDTLKQLF